MCHINHKICPNFICNFFKEALSSEFKEYAKQIIENAKTLCKKLQDRGFQIVSGGTDNHLMLVDLQNMQITGKEAEHLLDEANITCNKNYVHQWSALNSWKNCLI